MARRADLWFPLCYVAPCFQRAVAHLSEPLVLPVHPTVLQLAWMLTQKRLQLLILGKIPDTELLEAYSKTPYNFHSEHF